MAGIHLLGRSVAVAADFLVQGLLDGVHVLHHIAVEHVVHLLLVETLIVHQAHHLLLLALFRGCLVDNVGIFLDGLHAEHRHVVLLGQLHKVCINLRHRVECAAMVREIEPDFHLVEQRCRRFLLNLGSQHAVAQILLLRLHQESVEALQFVSAEQLLDGLTVSQCCSLFHGLRGIGRSHVHIQFTVHLIGTIEGIADAVDELRHGSGSQAVRTHHVGGVFKFIAGNLVHQLSRCTNGAEHQSH